MIIRKSTSKNTQETCSRRKQRRQTFLRFSTNKIKLNVLNVRLNYFSQKHINLVNISTGCIKKKEIKHIVKI